MFENDCIRCAQGEYGFTLEEDIYKPTSLLLDSCYGTMRGIVPKLHHKFVPSVPWKWGKGTETSQAENWKIAETQQEKSCLGKGETMPLNVVMKKPHQNSFLAKVTGMELKIVMYNSEWERLSGPLFLWIWYLFDGDGS